MDVCFFRSKVNFVEKCFKFCMLFCLQCRCTVKLKFASFSRYYIHVIMQKTCICCHMQSTNAKMFISCKIEQNFVFLQCVTLKNVDFSSKNS